MPRVVHVISTREGIGGAERVLEALLREGEARGWEQIVLNPFGRSSQGELLKPLLSGAAYESRPGERTTALPALRAWLGRRVAAARADVVHAHLFHALVLTASLRRGRHRSVATHHHGRYAEFAGRPGLVRLDRWAGRRFDRVVAVSGAVERLLRGAYGYPASKVARIPNGWAGRPREREGRPARPTVVSVANLRRQKGHGVLLEAFASVREAVPDARLVLVGEGELGPALRARARELGLDGHVEFAGAVLDVWPFLADADVFALASYFEPLGITALEGMAAGLPVVATAVDGLEEVVTPGVTGRLVPVADPAALAHELIELLRDENLRVAMGAAGREVAASRRLGDTASRYFELYEELLSRGREAA
jgi:glycosyltransferase involved in cell wall biosynthesis